MSPSLRDRAGRVARRVRAGAPQVSVVVEARGRESDVRAAIDSVRDQSERRLEILVVLVEEWLRPVAEEAGRGDWRVRVLDALGADPTAVRRLGAETAKGAHLLHLPPRQRLLPEAMGRLLAHREGEATVVAGGVAGRPDGGGAPVLGRLLVPRATWLAVVDDGEPDGQGAALRLLGAAHTTTTEPTLADDGPWRPRPFERPDDPRPRLEGRLVHDERMLTSLPADERPRRAAGLLARDLPPFLLAVERYDDEEWVRLQAHTAQLVAEATTRLLDVPVEDRMLAWLAAEDRRDDLVAYVAARRFAGGAFPTRVREGVIRAKLGVRGVSDVVLEVAEAESPLRMRVDRVSGSELVLWVGIARLDEEAPEVTVFLDGRPVPSELSSDPDVTRWMNEPHQCHDRGVVTVRAPDLDDVEVLEVEVVDRGVRRRRRWFVADLTESAPLPAKHPDLTDDEAGPYRQQRLQRRYLEVTEPVDGRLAYFQAFLGQAPTDHPGAIQAALQRVRPKGVRMLWGVSDSSVQVPEGAEPVLLRSQAWYDAMARAAWIVTNVELEPWFVRREGQEVLETYHGYPSKAMGLSQWRARDLTPSHVEQMLRRTSGTWNNLLTPIPEMDRYYRENYAFEGRIISQAIGRPARALVRAAFDRQLPWHAALHRRHVNLRRFGVLVQIHPLHGEGDLCSVGRENRLADPRQLQHRIYGKRLLLGDQRRDASGRGAQERDGDPSHGTSLAVQDKRLSRKAETKFPAQSSEKQR